MTTLPRKKTEVRSDADSRLRQFIGYNMKRAYHEIQAELAQAFRQMDLKIGSFAILSVVMEYPGLKQSVLAENLAIEQANLVQMLDELEKRELVKRERASQDRRAYALFLTEKGTQLYKQAHAICQSLEADFLQDCTGEEIDNLITTLQTIEAHVKAKRTAKND